MSSAEAALVGLIRRHLAAIDYDPSSVSAVLAERRNPACGDICRVVTIADETRVIADGCALCRGSAALADRLVRQADMENATRSAREVLPYFDATTLHGREPEYGQDDLRTEALELARLAQSFPARTQCVRLAWDLVAFVDGVRPSS